MCLSGQPNGVVRLLSGFLGRKVLLMSTYEILSLIINFGSLIIAYISWKNKKSRSASDKC